MRGSSAEGARVEAQKAPRGVGFGEGVSPSPMRKGSVPLPRKCFDFRVQNGEI